MIDPLSILPSCISLLFDIDHLVGKYLSKQKDCRMLCAFQGTLRTIMDELQLSSIIMADKGISATLKGLKEYLEDSCKKIEVFEKKKGLSALLKARRIAEELRGIEQTINTKVQAVVFAMQANSSSRLGTIEKTVADLHIKFESYQNGNERETEKTDFASRPEVQNKNENVLADSKVPHASLSDGSAKSTSVESVTGQGTPSIVNKIILRSTENMTRVRSIGVHPAKPWIVTGHKGGVVSIWDYQKQETVMEKQVNTEPSDFTKLIHTCSQYFKENPGNHWICSAKFITHQKWLAVGDGSGYIRIFDYTDTTDLPMVKKLKAHLGESVDLLAVHPTERYLLSSSAYGRTIKLWGLSTGWETIGEFDVKPKVHDGVLSLKFNPRDPDTFACVTDDGRVMVGNIKSSSLTTKLENVCKADYFFTRSDQHLMVTLGKSPNAEIRDLETRKVVHTLRVNGQKTRLVAGHPTLPILVTALDDGSVCFWDASTYRLKERVYMMDNTAYHLTVTDVNDITRVVVTSESMIAINEINLPMSNTS